MTVINNFDIICIATSEWEYPWGSRQEIMSRLSLENRVLFVEYQASVLHLFKYPRFLLKLFTPRIRYLSNRLMIYRPWFNLPFGYYNKTINLINQRLLLRQLKKLIIKLKLSNVLLWTFEPTSYFLVGKLKEALSIYHCIDSYKEEKKSFLRKKCIGVLEKRLCDKCDIIFVSTQGLLEEKAQSNKEAYLVPSGVSDSFLNAKNINLPLLICKFNNEIKGTRIGFVGTLDQRIDYELIEYIAKENPDWSILLVGLVTSKRSSKTLKTRKNVYFLGRKKHSVLPAYIKSFDVAIVPYKINEYTRGISSIKVYEYLAFGKAVVATEIPSLESLKNNGLIKTAENKEDFLEAIRNYIHDDSLAVRNARIEFAKLNTWEKRIESISGIIDDYIKRRIKHHA